MISVLLVAATALHVQKANPQKPLTIASQGAFSAGGTIIKSEGVYDPLKAWNVPQGGQTRHGDHADVFYQIPVKANKLSMVFLHGYGQSRRSWQTTADGSEGFTDLFLRRGYGVYLVDQPGRGDAGQTTKPTTITATPDDQTWFTQFRIGQYPNFYEGVQFPKDSLSAKQWAKVVNAHGGDATIVHLPEIGLKGNTHFPMSDLNNQEVAEVLTRWLKQKGLDR